MLSRAGARILKEPKEVPMATKRQILAAMLATPLSLVSAPEAGARPRDWDGPMRERIRDYEPPPIEGGIEVTAPGVPGKVDPVVTMPCTSPGIDGGQIRGRAFSSTMDIKSASGSPMGTIESEGSGWVIKNTDGSVAARAAESGDDEKRTISVTGCNGEPVGTITVTRAGWRGERVIEAKDASGASIGSSGNVDYLQDDWSLGGIRYEDDHWLLDSWRIRGKGDARIAMFAAMANSSANRRESQSRNSERERGGGRGDR